MAGTKPEQEPSIEEILASIRQIISDDEEPREAGTIEVPQEEKFEIPVYQPSEEPEEPVKSFADVLDLTNEVGIDEKVMDYSEPKVDIPLSRPAAMQEPPSRESDLDLSFGEEPARKSDLDLSAGQNDIDAIFTAPAASATTQAFERLLGNLPVEREENSRMYADGRITLEDITKDLLRPMLRQWVDDNVPKLVERLVQKEIERITRQVRD